MNQTAPRTPASFRHRPLLHPVVVGSLALLVINDHWLKVHHASWATGKLSDVAFMILAPIWLAILASSSIDRFVSRERSGSRRLPSSERLILGLMIGAVGLFFTAMQLTEAGDWAYRVTLAALQWPGRTIWELARGSGIPPLILVQATRDPSDLICLPFLAVAWSIGAPQKNSNGDSP